MNLTTLIKILIILLFSTTIQAQEGAIDTTFYKGKGPNGTISDFESQSDGKILVVGNFFTYHDQPRLQLVRILPDGQIDTSFHTGTDKDGHLYTAKVLPDGKILIAGTFFKYGGKSSYSIARLFSNGTLDTTFSAPVEVTEVGAILQVAILSDNKILVSGGGFVENSKILRLYPNGEIDHSFNSGVGITSTYKPNCVYAMAIQKDGKILIGGNYSYLNGVRKNGIARLNTDGSIDNSFSTGTGFDDGRIHSIVIQKDDKIIIGGAFTKYNSTTVAWLVRLNSNGTIDPAFLGEPNISIVHALALQEDEKIFTGGEWRKLNRLKQDRSEDGSFSSPEMIGNQYQITSLQFQGEDKIIAGGYFQTANGYNNIARFSLKSIITSEDNVDEQGAHLAIFPNPNYGELNITSKKASDFNLLDGKGILINNFSLKENNGFSVSIKNLPKGLYLIHPVSLPDRIYKFLVQ